MKKKRMTHEEVDALIERIVQKDKEREDNKISLFGKVDHMEKEMVKLHEEMYELNTILNAMWQNPAFDGYRSKVKK